jgi:hypothetical protein
MVGAHGQHSLLVTTGPADRERNLFSCPLAFPCVTFPRPSVDIRSPPDDLDALIDWFELVSYNLVLLEEYPLEQVRSAMDAVSRAVGKHLGSTDPTPANPRQYSAAETDGAHLLASDHEWFRTSLEQLWWFFAVVEREDHGGNRQALGQYGRVLSESLRRHRRDEQQFWREVSAKSGRTDSSVPPGNPN